MSNSDTVTPAKHKPLFLGVCASSITPFHADGTFAFDRLKPHIDWLIAEGVSAISPLGSSGEYAGMESDDRKRVMEASIEACAGRVPIVAGTHHVSTRLTIELSKHAEGVGAAMKPPVFLQPGDTVTIDIEKIGAHTNPVVTE